MKPPTRMQAEAFELSAAGYTRREIAAKLRRSPSAIKKRLIRGRRRAKLQADTQARYGRVLSRPPGGKPVRFKPFSLSFSDNV